MIKVEVVFDGALLEISSRNESLTEDVENSFYLATGSCLDNIGKLYEVYRNVETDESLRERILDKRKECSAQEKC